jgi:hypothetical protein
MNFRPRRTSAGFTSHDPAGAEEIEMGTTSEQIRSGDAIPQDQKLTRAVVATLLVVGLVLALTTEMWFGRAAPISGEGVAPTMPPTMEWGVSPGPAGPAGPDEFQDRVPTPPGIVVG